MCGVSALIYRGFYPDEAIRKMNKRISHRGPDNSSFKIFDRLNLALGHTRLSVIDLNAASNQPMEYEGRYWISYNGEIYNYREIQNELLERGYRFKTKSDTEVIMAAYDLWGNKCLERFNGMFSFILLDLDKKLIFCARDRFGIKPLYYTTLENGTIAFGSEIKQFFDLPGFIFACNERVAIDYLVDGLIDHTEETFYSGVKQVRGGEACIYFFDSQQFSKFRWYDLNKNGDNQIPYEEAVDKFSELFFDSVRLQLHADVMVGSCLSGGLDSSSIVAAVNSIVGGKSQKTFSACYEDADFDERFYINLLRNQYKFECHKLFPQVSMVPEKLKELIYIQDGPFISSSIFAQWSVFKSAHESGIVVMLDGQGADEVLAGYHSFYYAYLANLLSNFNLTSAWREANLIKKLHGFGIMKLLKYAVLNFIPLKFKYLLFGISGWNLLSRHALNLLINSRAAGFSGGGGIAALSQAQIFQTNLPALLHYEDRNSMAHSIEARVPFLDHRLVEFVFSLKDSYKIRNGWTKALLRDGPGKILPSKIKRRRDKMGFATPEYKFFNANIDILNFLRTIDDPLLNRDAISSKLDSINKNGQGYDAFLWRAACYAKWKQTLL